ncbi:MAG: hypothetical protein IPM91_11205 [Bacteroidetes bacterium]|nr:hypothetical protein [Bacteroidota bacterium]
MKAYLLFLFSFLTLQSFGQGDSIFSFFSVQQQANEVALFFTVKGGIQCSGVRVQRSVDGMNFTTLYEFPGVCGSPSGDESYLYIDELPEKNRLNYYRLEVGSLNLFSEEKQILFYFYEKGKLQISPNPCTVCTIRFPNEKREPCEIFVYNYEGRLIYRNITKENFLSLENAFQAEGFLHIYVIYKDGKKISGNLISE